MTTYENLIEVLPKLVSLYYDMPGNSCGGNLHIVLDDGNLEDSDLQFCKERAQENDDTFGVFICDTLSRLPDVPAREKALDPWFT